MSKTKHLLIRSKDRSYGTPGDFSVNLDIPLQDLKGVALLSLSLPNVIYNVVSTNNKFYFKDSSDVVVTLPNGSYNINTLIAELTNQMNTSGAQVYTISYSTTSMRLTISAAGNFTIQTGDNTINYILGFEVTASATSHEATNVVRLDFPSFLFIEITEFYSLFSKTTTGNAYGNFIIPISTNSQSLEIFNRNISYPVNVCYGSSNITSLSVKLRKDNGDIVNINGLDWAMLIGLVYE